MYFIYIRINGHFRTGSFPQFCNLHTLGLQNTRTCNIRPGEKMLHPDKIRAYSIGHRKAGHPIPVNQDTHYQFRESLSDFHPDSSHIGNRFRAGNLADWHIVHILENDAIKMVFGHHFRFFQRQIRNFLDVHITMPVTARQRLRLYHG